MTKTKPSYKLTAKDIQIVNLKTEIHRLMEKIIVQQEQLDQQDALINNMRNPRVIHKW